MSEQRRFGFADLVDIIAELRHPERGCPWDLEQTHESLKPYLLEEAYEVLDAIESDRDHLPEELGDVLLQVMLHSRIAEDEERFSIADVIDTLAHKLVRRHPHVFGTDRASTAGEVIHRWEAVKEEERGSPRGLLDGIPRSMPALAAAEKIGAKVARVGFDWPDVQPVLEKVREELREVEAELCSGNVRELEEELGDLLFSIAQLCRKCGIPAERALERANSKFRDRFAKMEQQSPHSLRDLSAEELQLLWSTVKASKDTSSGE